MCARTGQHIRTSGLTKPRLAGSSTGSIALPPATARHIDEADFRSQTAAQRRRFGRRQTKERKLKAYLWPADGTTPPPMSRWRRFVDRNLPSVVIYLMVATLVAVVLYPHMVITVPSGYIGVLWKRFSNGTVLDPRLLKNEGFNFVSPWNRVFLYDLLVTGIELPAAIVGAINRKTEQYYISEEYKFRVEREKRESERKKIEGEGIRDFQQVVSQGISDSYLRWRGIEATLQLSQSMNSKVVIIGSGKAGLPIILGNVDSPAPSAGTAQPSGNDTADKQKATAAGPAVPFEKTPAAALTMPAEKLPAATSGAAPPATPAPAPAASAQETRSLWPTITLSDIESYLAKMLLPTPKTESKQTAAEQPR